MSGKKKVKVTVTTNIDNLVRVTDDYCGMCVLCGSYGWLSDARYGYPAGSPEAKAAGLEHKPACPLNEHLTPRGKLK